MPLTFSFLTRLLIMECWPRGVTPPPQIFMKGLSPPPKKKSVRRDFNHVNVASVTLFTVFVKNVQDECPNRGFSFQNFPRTPLHTSRIRHSYVVQPSPPPPPPPPQLLIHSYASVDPYIFDYRLFYGIQLIQLRLPRSKGKRSNTSAKSLLGVAIISLHKPNQI